MFYELVNYYKTNFNVLCIDRLLFFKNGFKVDFKMCGILSVIVHFEFQLSTFILFRLRN